MTSPRRTTWGVLSLIEDPPLPKGVKSESVPRPISDKVPRSIVLHGQSTLIGRVKRGNQSMPQTQILLPYISSSHCCFFLRRSGSDGTIEAALTDTSSNGTFVNDSKVGKKNVLSLKFGDEIALYRPQGVSPLGMPIVYKLELHEGSFAQAVEERLEKVSGQQTRVSATPARGRGGGAGRGDGPNGPSTANVGGTGRTNRGGFPRSRTATSAASVNGRAGDASRGVVIPTPSEQGQAGPATTLSDDGKGTVAPSSAAAGPTRGVMEVSSAAAASPALGGTGTGTGAAFSSTGDERSVLAMMDDQNAIRKAAEAEAQRRVQVERDGLLRQIRYQGARLEETSKNHQELLAKSNALEEQLAEAESSGRREHERVVELEGLGRKMKEAVEKAECQREAAVALAAQEHSKADAAERAAAEARTELQTTKADLQAQVDGLIEKIIRHEGRMTDLMSNKLVLEKEVGVRRAQVAEAMGKCSGLEAQLKEARDADQDLRSRLSRIEQVFGELRQEKAEVEGKLAQRDRELKASEESRERLEKCSDEARKLSLELKDTQGALSRETQELEQLKSQFEEERAAREVAEASAADLGGDLAKMSSEAQRLQKLLDEALEEGQKAKAQADEVSEQLKQASKGRRSCEAQLLETRNELERVKNRKEGLAVEALMRGRNLKKAERAVRDISKLMNEQLAMLLEQLKMPGEGVVLDSQGGLGAGSVLGEETIDGNDDMEIPRDDRNGPDSPATVDAEEGDEEQPGGTQVNPSSTNVEVLPSSPSRVGRGEVVCGADGIEGGGVMGGMEIGSPLAAGENANGEDDDGLTDDDEVRNTQDADEEGGGHHREHEEGEDLTGGEVELAPTTQMVDEVAGTVGGDERRGATAESDGFRGGGGDGNDQNDDASSTCTERSSNTRLPVTATLEEPTAGKSVAKSAAEPEGRMAVEPEDGGAEVHQRLEEEAGDEEDSGEDGEGEFTVPSLNFYRGEKVSETRVSGGLGDGNDDGDRGEDAQGDGGSFRDGARSALFETSPEDVGEAGAGKAKEKEEEKVVDGEVEVTGVRGSPRGSIGGDSRKRGREDGDGASTPDMVSAEARVDRKKPRADSENDGADGRSRGEHGNLNPHGWDISEHVQEEDTEFREGQEKEGRVEDVRNGASSDGQRGDEVKEATTSCCQDTSGNVIASVDAGSDNGSDNVDGGGQGDDDEEEEEEEMSASGRAGGQCETAIDLSQDDETGEDYF